MSVARPKVWRPVIQEAKHIWRLFIGDEVQVVKKGPDEGSKGKVIALLRDEKKPELIVEGLNMRKKKIFTGMKEDDFFVVTMEHPMDYSDVLLLDPVSKKPVETVFRFLADGRQVRLGVGPNASSQIIFIPERPDKVAKAGLQGPKDTSEEEAKRSTYDPSAPFPFPFQSQKQSTSALEDLGTTTSRSESRPRLWERPMNPTPNFLTDSVRAFSTLLNSR